MDNLVKMRLVPVEVFGSEECCEHGQRDLRDPPCPSMGYGLMDAVAAWSDCNRAIGHIYRVDDMDPHYRHPGETVNIWVKPEDVTWFERKFSQD
jgi:hypothetical protein